MAEKNKKTNNGVKADEHPEKKKQDSTAGNNKAVTIVLKSDLHCEECVSKVLKCIRSFDGVEKATVDDGPRISVVGKVDPAKLRERVEKNTHKKVEIVMPPTKTDVKNRKNKESNEKNSNKKSKEKEFPVTTAVLRTRLHCPGCTQKIGRLVSKSKGYREMKIDREKELVTVTGAMDMNALARLLKKHLKKEVEILQPKKENEEKKEGGEKGKGGGGDQKGKSGGGDKKGGGNGEGGGEKVVEGNKLQGRDGNYPYPIVYGQVQYSNPYAPQIFSDENPNACSVM